MGFSCQMHDAVGLELLNGCRHGFGVCDIDLSKLIVGSL